MRKKKEESGSNFLTPINDRAQAKKSKITIDPSVPGIPREKLGDFASRNRHEKERKREEGMETERKRGIQRG